MSFSIFVLWMAMRGGLLFSKVLNYLVLVIIFPESLF